MNIDFNNVKDLSIDTGKEVKSITVNGELLWSAGEALPAGYTELQYVENISNGYPTYLVLDHKFNSTHSKLTIDFQLPNYTSRKIAGCKADGTRGKGFDLSLGGYYFGDYYSTDLFPTPVKEIFHNVEIGKQALYINGELKAEFTKQPETTCLNDLAIGVCYGSGSTLSIINGYHRIGRVKLEYDDDVLFNLIPCINPDGVAGFYDLVNEVFRGSESGYDWTAGAET